MLDPLVQKIVLASAGTYSTSNKDVYYTRLFDNTLQTPVQSPQMQLNFIVRSATSPSRVPTRGKRIKTAPNI